VPEVGQLVRRAAAGDEGAWNGLVDRFNGLVWAVARAHRLPSADAADVVQTTWLRAVERLDRVNQPERVGAWLATIARNESLRALSQGSRQRPAGTELLLEVADDARVDAALLEEERDAALWQAFERLDERCQALLRVLVADPAPSYQEVAAALDMPIGSIGPTRGRCLEKLRDMAEAAGLSDESRREP
jgi:RNA polymerase sigma factor (sigma-70 family)